MLVASTLLLLLLLLLLLCLISTDDVYIRLLLLLCFDVVIFLHGCGVKMVAESTMEIIVESCEDFGNNLFLKISNLFLKKDVICLIDV